MGEPILYVRYFYPGLAGLVLAVSLIAGRVVAHRALLGVGTGIALLLTALSMTFWVPRNHSDENADAGAFLASVNTTAAVVSSDCEAGTLVTGTPGTPGTQVTLAGYTGSTLVSYEAYEPGLRLCASLDEAFAGGQDEFWYLETPTTLYAVDDVPMRFGYRVTDSREFYRPISSKTYRFCRLERVTP